MLVDLQNCGQVVATVTIVRCTEDRCYLLVVLMRVSFVHQLMGSCYQSKIVGVTELLCDVLNYEGITSPNRKPAPLGLYL